MDVVGGVAGMTWEESLGKGLYHLLYKRQKEIDRKIRESPRLSEILQPEQIAKEYPHTSIPMRTPRSRAEMEIIQEDDLGRQRMMRSMSGQYTSAIPYLFPALAGGLAASTLEIVPIIFGVGSMGLLSQFSKMRTLATTAALSLIHI